tara:strand:+ start:1442 stop:1753 length:312 start_codon:yes stop_codon:yes gene_type:complete
MKKVITSTLLILLLTSCQSAKDAFTLKKKNTADEFLVEKKSPLVLPPDYGKLPMPENEKIVNDDTSQDEVKNLVTSDKKILPSKIKKNTKPTSLEKLIIKKIK